MRGKVGMDMISVMIVDDEYIVREDLKTLIDWEKEGFQIVAEAENGVRGLGMYRQFRPQLIFADIKMPVMDGLAMSQKILEENPETKIILLTAYSDFDYARKAMEQEIHSYLLKHEIDEESLIRELGRVKEVIEGNELRWRKERSRLIRLALLEEKEDGLEELSRGTMCMALAFFGQDDEGRMRQEEIRKEISFMDNEYLIEIDGQEYALLLDVSGIKGERELESRARQIYDVLKGMAAKGEDVFLAVSKGYSGKESPASWYRRTQRLLKYRYFEKGSEIFYAWDYEKEEESDRSEQHFYELIRNFQKALQEKEIENVCRQLDVIFEEMKESRNLDYFDKMVRFLGMSLWNEKVAFEKETHLTPEEMIGTMKKVRDIDDMAKWVRNEFRQLYHDIQNNYSPRVRHALRYIKDNYNKDITLAQIAEVMEISEIYASTYFKKEVGMSYLRYLTEYRMKVAKELIEKGYKVYEISEMVGYQTVQYFTTMFKKYVGCTPKEYYNQAR